MVFLIKDAILLLILELLNLIRSQSSSLFKIDESSLDSAILMFLL